MTEVEKNTEFISKQRTRIIKLANEINGIVVEYNLDNGYKRYYIEYECYSSGNYMAIKVYDERDSSLVGRTEYSILSSILNPTYFSFSQSEMQKIITKALKEMRKMKTLALKYVALNEKENL